MTVETENEKTTPLGLKKQDKLLEIIPTIVILIIGIIVAIGTAVWFRIELKSSETTITKKDSRISILDTKNNHLEKELAFCIKGINNPPKRNIIDMKEYIAARYTKVPKELAEIIAIKTNKLCIKHNMDFSIIVGLMEVESSYNPFAKSKVDARGLLQVMYKVWAKEMNIKREKDLYGIEYNIDTGIRILKHYIDKNKGNLTKALQNYNGSGGTDFSNKVYIAVGKFTTFRNSTYGRESKTEGKGTTTNDTSETKNIGFFNPKVGTSGREPS